MMAYVARRVLLMLPTVLGVITLVFLFIHFIPGDPVVLMLGETAMPADIVQLRHTLGLDVPPVPVYAASEEIRDAEFRPVRAGRWRILWRWHDVNRTGYARFLAGLARGDLGTSLTAPYPSVNSVIAGKLPYTVLLAIASLSVGLAIALPLGITAAVKANSWIDRLSMGLALAGIAIPNFWLGPMLIIVFAIKLDWLPVSGTGSPLHLILPAVTLGTGLAALLTRMTRSSLLDVLNAEYITAARAKGLSEPVVIVKHALRNALIPVVTVLGLQFGALLGGSIITEKIFSWPGIGRELITAINQRDFPLVQGYVLVISLGYLAVNLITDLLYAAIDPRVRLAGRN